MSSVFFYISGHGYGHASRDIEIVDTLGRAGADDLVIRTSVAPWLFDRSLRVPFTLLEGATDTGVVQIDSLHLDERATIRRAAEFHRELAARAADEAVLLERHDARLVVADAPPLGCAAAAAAGIPCVVLSNFTWDWIYQGYPEPLADEEDLIPRIQEAYRRARAGWRLPMHGGFATFETIVDLPFVARHATVDPGDVRTSLGLPRGVPLVLMSFGGYGVRGLDPSRLDCLDTFAIVTTTAARAGTPRVSSPRGVHVVNQEEMYELGLRYEDLIAAVDVVATKPGYGIISECIANDTAILYTSRGRFVEYDVFVAEMPRYLRCQFIEIEDLLAGRWCAALDTLMSAPPPSERPRTDGAQIAAGMIIGLRAMEA